MVYNDRTAAQSAVNSAYPLSGRTAIHTGQAHSDCPIQPLNGGFAWTIAGICGRATAFILMLLGLPCFAAVALITWVLSRDSPLVAHERIGLHGKPFWVLKLRTMWPRRTERVRAFKLLAYLPPDPVPERKHISDPRITSAFAGFCRRYSIDEWPQL